MELAPIAIFACKRPEHLSQLLQSLALNFDAHLSDITIFVGGPMDSKDWSLVMSTVKVAHAATGFKSVVLEEKFEITAAGALLEYGISKILAENTSLIVLEDDLLVREDFIRYMNESLEKYKDEESVAQISGWNWGKTIEGSPNSTHLFPVTTSWGWATWHRAWNKPRNISQDYSWLTEKSRRIHKFNLNEIYDYLGMIESVEHENYDAWDVKWYLSCFRNEKLVLYPNSSLVINQGFDGSGLNFSYRFKWIQNFQETAQVHFQFQNKTERSPYWKKYLKNFMKWVKVSEGGDIQFVHRVGRKVKQHIRYAKKATTPTEGHARTINQSKLEYDFIGQSFDTSNAEPRFYRIIAKHFDCIQRV